MGPIGVFYPIDKLSQNKLNLLEVGTKFIKEVLMCKPNHFSIDYQINPWMKIASVDKSKAQLQWNKIVESLQKSNIKVNIIKQKRGLPDMVFAADQAIIKNKNLVISNFRYPERQKESEEYISWFEKQNFTIHKLPNKYYFEGSGESVWQGNRIFIGSGFRNSPKISKYISRLLGVEAIELELVNPFFYHLDTCLFIINTENAFYYPPAFSKKSIKILQNFIPNLITLEKDEAYNFAANNFVANKEVMMQIGNKSLSYKIKSLGYKTTELDVSEFMKAGGGIHCLVLDMLI